MSERRRRSESLWDRQEEVVPQNETKEFHSSFLEGGLPELSNLEANDVLMPQDFSGQPSRDPIQNSSRPSDDSFDQPNRGGERRVSEKNRDRSRSRSLSPHRIRNRDRDTGQGGRNKPDNDSKQRWSDRPEHSGGSRFRDDRNADQDYRRQSNRRAKEPCRFFLMGQCNRPNCNFSHDLPKSGNSDDKNKYLNDPSSWNSFELEGINEEISRDKWNESEKNSSTLPQSTNDTYNMDMSNLNTNESNLQLNGSVEGVFLQLDGEKPDPQASGLPQNPNITIIDSMVTNEQNQMPLEPVGNKIAENPPNVVNAGKSEVQGKVEEGNDEKAMRQFKIALVEFVKEILKPTWKEGKMSREVYKTIVKKVVEKVTSTIQGVQIPRGQEKIDQYLTFSKSKITKLVEAYVGRLVKA